MRCCARLGPPHMVSDSNEQKILHFTVGLRAGARTPAHMHMTRAQARTRTRTHQRAHAHAHAYACWYGMRARTGSRTRTRTHLHVREQADNYAQARVQAFARAITREFLQHHVVAAVLI